MRVQVMLSKSLNKNKGILVGFGLGIETQNPDLLRFVFRIG
jgi:hypothetical protein